MLAALWLLAAATAAAQMPAETASRAEGAEAAETARFLIAIQEPATREALTAALAKVGDRIDQLQRAASSASDGEEGVAVVAEQDRLDRLQALRILLQRRLTLEDRSRQLDAALAEQDAQRRSFEQNGLEQEPPYSLLFLDSLRDQRRLVEREQAAEALSLEALRESLRRAEVEIEMAEKAGRQARDALEAALREEDERASEKTSAPAEERVRGQVAGTSPDKESVPQPLAEEVRPSDGEPASDAAPDSVPESSPDADPKPAREPADLVQARAALEQARLDELIARQAYEAVATQIVLAERDQALDRERLQLLGDKIRRAQPLVEFSAEDLEARLADIRERREDLEKTLRERRTARDSDEGKLYEARADLQRAQDEAGRSLLTEKVAAREAWLEARNRGIQYLEQQIAHTTAEELLWERRYTLVNELSAPDLRAWLDATEGQLQDLERERRVIEARLDALRGSQLDLDQRLRGQGLEDKGLQAEVRDRLAALEAHETFALEYLAAITRLTGLAGRLEAQIEAAVAARSFGERLREQIERLRALWGLELFVYEDRSITVGRAAMMLGAFLGVLVLVSVLRAVLARVVLRRWLREGVAGRKFLRDLVAAFVRRTNPLFALALAVWAALYTLPFRVSLHQWTDLAVFVLFYIQIALWANAVLYLSLRRSRLRREQQDPSSASAYELLNFFGRVAVWAIVLLTALHVQGFQITGLVAGLGIGGIAIAFALQSILADVFNSFAILLDKPFRLGDFIIVGDLLGVVEKIGIKTTRIRSLWGEEIVFSNSDLLGSRIRNYKRMVERRVAFTFGVIYQTRVEQLASIPPLVREIIEAVPGTRFDRAHFYRYGDYALEFEVVYYVLSPDYNLYMDIHQSIHLGIFGAFQREGIEFAYPTQELYLKSSPRPVGDASDGMPPDSARSLRRGERATGTVEWA